MFIAAHSGLRFLVLLAGVLVVLYSIYGLVTKRPYDKSMAVLASSFAGLVHLQILLGIGVLFTGTFYPALIGHLFMMGAAAAVAQATSSVMRRRRQEDKTFAPHLIGTVLALGLIAGGIAAIGRGVFQSTI